MHKLKCIGTIDIFIMQPLSDTDSLHSYKDLLVTLVVAFSNDQLSHKYHDSRSIMTS